MTLADLLPDALGKIEENVPSAGNPAAPIFWSLVGEVYPCLVDAMNEAALLTGVVQLNGQQMKLAKNTTYFSAPKGTMGAIRMKAPYPIRKVSLRGLDDMVSTWQAAAPAAQIQAWFPVGVNQFGIYPQLSAEAVVTMDFLAYPVQQGRPLSGSVTVPFQVEFGDAFSEYAAVMLRSKEGGAEAEEAAVVYQEYLGQMKSLSAFQGRLDDLVRTAAWGGMVQANPRKIA